MAEHRPARPRHLVQQVSLRWRRTAEVCQESRLVDLGILADLCFTGECAHNLRQSTAWLLEAVGSSSCVKRNIVVGYIKMLKVEYRGYRLLQHFKCILGKISLCRFFSIEMKKSRK